MRTLLIDGDTVCYQIACAAEAPIDFGDGILCHHQDSLDAAKASLDTRIQGYQEVLDADDLIVALTDGENWRKDIYPAYKSNRKDKPKPAYLADLRKYLHESYKVYQRPRLEADDCLGILSTGKMIVGERIIVSIDKDFLQIPGLLFNPNRAEEGIREISGAEADRWHMMQTLTGDSCDGYPGCKGIGAAKATKILDAVDPENWWDVIVALYRAYSTEDPLTQARVARILRSTDYDYTKKEPILWTPSNDVKSLAS